MLVTVIDAIQSLGLSETLEDSLTPVLTKAITRAQIRLEAELSTKLDILDCAEIFKLDLNLFNNLAPNGLIALRTKNSNIAISPAATLSACTSSWNAEYTVIPETDYMTDFENGLVYLDTVYAQQYVRIGYRSGFRSDKDCRPQVREALLAILPSVLTVLSDGEQKNDQGSAAQAQAAAVLIDQLKRPHGLAFKPIVGTATIAPKPVLVIP